MSQELNHVGLRIWLWTLIKLAKSEWRGFQRWILFPCSSGETNNHSKIPSVKL